MRHTMVQVWHADLKSALHPRLSNHRTCADSVTKLPAGMDLKNCGYR